MLLWYNITLFLCLFLCICSFNLYTLLLYVVKIYVSFFSGCRAGENVIQPTEDVMVVEGQPTTLSCQFDTADLSPYLFWYKQQTNSNPIFMLRRDTFSSGETTTEFQERFDARLNFTAKSVPLTIQRVQLSESAVYYCALRPTVTTGIQPPYKNYRFHMSIETHCKTGCKATTDLYHVSSAN
uniref:Ig-like domain-containing protein n=1 Tax=Hucho hucho TaxID=62062 RepID=A0A4W5K0G1_9TELE